jgi:hypothetical protein
MNAVVQPLFAPIVDTMRAHVEHLFGGYLDGCHDGLIELAWTDTQPDAAGRYRLKNARLFGTDQIEELVSEASRLNLQPMCNVYIGAALRKPTTAPFGRAVDADAYALTAAYVDLDDEGAATAAKDIYGKAKPTFIVVTGRAPHTRAQMWWRLDEPLTDPEQWPALLRGMAAAMRADSTVTNPSRVMRLAGSVAWPVKDGRKTEMTDIGKLVEPGQTVYAYGHLASMFPPVASSQATAAPAAISRTTNSLGLSDKINDGREAYMTRTIAACLVEYIGTTGSAPTPQELYEAAWPQYERHVDFSRAGRGPEEFAEKCAYTVSRFARGEIRGVETLDKAVEVYRGKAQAKASAPRVEAPKTPQPARQDRKIQTVDFLTLMTETVEEEPDYIEPGFAGPGNFVLIAGPPKAQKSFLLQEMLVACATGTSFLMDVFKVAKPLKVFYLQAEMNRKLLRKRAREFKLLTPDQRRQLSTNLIVSERFHMILNEDGVKTAIATIRESFPGDPPDIIAVDPLANVFDQENENDNAQLMRFLTGRIEAIRQAINPLAAIIMVHHAAKKSSEDMARDPFVAIRGAGSLRGYYDSAIVIFRASEEGKSRKVHFELRSGESPEPMVVELEGGRFVKAQGEASKIDKPTARRMLQAVRDAWAANEPMSPFPQSRGEGRFVVYNLSREFSMPARDVKILVEEWLRLKVLTMRPVLSRVRPAGLEVTGSID